MAAQILETVTIKLPDGSLAVINKSDFDPAMHHLAPVAGDAAPAAEGNAAPAAKSKKKAPSAE